ncbi:general secretion pathway protein B [Lysobacter niabensis]|uniref:General secretion pathway protein B n=1 Tax=Agrilutibacter niabensis TaxID=380628 RepID=A0ABU1VQA1_9GAMM|nr:general secretion pathway protein GspB [Lysobacter niabensis]MDR7099500.1 general secretion pathway protein B [Lysobacter niabensis]
MSLILEALRRSEAERRRGQTPDLLSDATPVAPTAATATRHRNASIAVAAAALATLLLLAWWLRPALVEPATSPTASEPTVPAVVSPPASLPLQPRASAPVTTAATGAVTMASAAPLAPPPVASPRPRPPSAVAATPNNPEPASVAAAVVPAPLQAPTRVVSEPPATTAQPSFTSPDLPLRLSDLSSDERQQLPALKVSMHMWAPDAADRFAIIDGTRVNQGDRLGEATVESIQNDGVILTWRGRRLRLPIR